jgi:hypothetical protein
MYKYEVNSSVSKMMGFDPDQGLKTFSFHNHVQNGCGTYCSHCSVGSGVAWEQKLSQS